MGLPNDEQGIDDGTPNLGWRGLIYISITVIYTAVVLGGLLKLFVSRKKHEVRIRNFWLIAGSVLSLHVYLVLILMVYPLNGLFKCGAEFWIMSIWLPFGMALFQASNIRLYSYAVEQKSIQLQEYMSVHSHCCSWKRPRPRHWWKHLSIEKRTYVGIGIGMLIQCIVTCILFFGSRKFHKSYGFFSDHVSAGECRRGTEWAPSIIWQLLWSTIFGPFVLLQVRRIADTHYWALQTMIAIVACVPGTPLWLTFVYLRAPGIDKVNRWLPPSGWFLPGLVAIQFVSVFFPLFDLRQNRKLEENHANDIRESCMQTGIEPNTKGIYSMASFDLALKNNREHLLTYAATKQFTAENIVFLTSVLRFKRKWESIGKRASVTGMTPDQLRERYEDAAFLFFTLINPHTARMNINIDHKTYQELENMFKGCKYEAYSDDSSSCSKGSSTYTENIVAPWEDCTPGFEERPSSSGSRDFHEKTLGGSEVDKLYQIPVTEIYSKEDPAAQDVLIPATFSIEVFDAAYQVVKNDVYLNTWVRYNQAWGAAARPSIIKREEINKQRDTRYSLRV